ncbi:uncharacterized protein LOC142359279 [Opisthocomus hoazin]|uniref:uncharacterized protein LOC142359279 n=1 Tax=Opisthocomus hoazin TaxID=30419 RepID=UPI003F5351AA
MPLLVGIVPSGARSLRGAKRRADKRSEKGPCGPPVALDNCLRLQKRRRPQRPTLECADDKTEAGDSGSIPVSQGGARSLRGAKRRADKRSEKGPCGPPVALDNCLRLQKRRRPQRPTLECADDKTEAGDSGSIPVSQGAFCRGWSQTPGPLKGGARSLRGAKRRADKRSEKGPCGPPVALDNCLRLQKRRRPQRPTLECADDKTEAGDSGSIPVSQGAFCRGWSQTPGPLKGGARSLRGAKRRADKRSEKGPCGPPVALDNCLRLQKRRRPQRPTLECADDKTEAGDSGSIPVSQGAFCRGWSQTPGPLKGGARSLRGAKRRADKRSEKGPCGPPVALDNCLRLQKRRRPQRPTLECADDKTEAGDSGSIPVSQGGARSLRGAKRRADKRSEKGPCGPPVALDNCLSRSFGSPPESFECISSWPLFQSSLSCLAVKFCHYIAAAAIVQVAAVGSGGEGDVLLGWGNSPCFRWAPAVGWSCPGGTCELRMVLGQGVKKAAGLTRSSASRLTGCTY